MTARQMPDQAGERSGHREVGVLTISAPAGPVGRVVVGVDGSPSSTSSAQLLVLGARGDGTFPGPLFGSTGDQCVLHAPGPVAVIHAPHAG